MSNIALLAPTGRASKRLKEVTGHNASTIHKLLGYTGRRFTVEEVDAKLKGIMKGIHDQICGALDAYGLPYNLVAGANLAGFKKVAQAMMEQGCF